MTDATQAAIAAAVQAERERCATELVRLLNSLDKLSGEHKANGWLERASGVRDAFHAVKSLAHRIRTGD